MTDKPSITLRSENATFGWALVIALLSGCAALSHEILWSRRLIDLLGGSNESVARVFGCFFLGLAGGAAFATRFTPRLKRPWRAVALVELGIGLAALPAMTLPHWTAGIWPALGLEQLVGPTGQFIKFSLSILIVFPPAFLMGMTLPFMARGALRGNSTLARHGTWIYAVNTAGGVLGMVLTVGVTLAVLGSVTGAMSCAIFINLVIAALAFWLDRKSHPTEIKPQNESETPALDPGKDTVPIWWLFVVVFFSGFAVLAIEIVTLQLIHHVVPSTMYSASGVLVAVIILLTLSAALSPVMVGKLGARKWLVVAASLCALLTALAPLLFVLFTRSGEDLNKIQVATFNYQLIEGGLQRLESTSSLGGFVWSLVWIVTISFGPGLLLAGFVLPATFAWHQDNGADPHGVRWGWLLAINGLGGLCGAELASQVIIPWLGVHSATGLIAVGYALLACGLLWIGTKRIESGYAGLAMIALIVAVAVGLVHSRQLPVMRTNPNHDVLTLKSGREGVVAVVEQNTRQQSWRKSIVHNSSFRLGSTGAYQSQRRKTLLPMILHPKPSRVGVIGVATGITAGGPLDHPDLEELVAVEISPLVAEAAQKYFGEENRDIGKDPRSKVIVEDGRTFIASASEEFDVIVGDLFRPWNPGVGRLYSVEHFQNVRRALKPGGVFCQWFPMYQVTDHQFQAILATFAEVFPKTHLLRGSFSSTSPSIALVGFRDGDIDWAGLAERTARMRDSKIDEPGLRSPAGLMTYYMGFVPEQHQHMPLVNTLDNAWIEVQASRDRVSGVEYLRGKYWLELEAGLLKLLELPAEVKSEPQNWRALANQFMQYDFLRKTNIAASVAMKADLQKNAPKALFEDTNANWASWPNRPNGQ